MAFFDVFASGCGRVVLRSSPCQWLVYWSRHLFTFAEGFREARIPGACRSIAWKFLHGRHGYFEVIFVRAGSKLRGKEMVGWERRVRILQEGCLGSKRLKE